MEIKNEAVKATSGAGGSEPRSRREQPNERATDTKVISDEDKAVAALLSGMAKETAREEEKEDNQRARRSTRRKKNHLYKDYETDFNKWDVDEVQEDSKARRSKIPKTEYHDVTYGNGVQLNQFGLLHHLLNGSNVAHPKAALPNRRTIAKFIESFEKQRRQAQNTNKTPYSPGFMGVRQGNSAFFVPQQRPAASPAALTTQTMQNIARPPVATGEASSFPQSGGISELIESLKGSLNQPPQHGGYEQQLLQFASQGVQRPVPQQEPMNQIQGLLERLQQHQSPIAPPSARTFPPYREWQDNATVGVNPSPPSTHPFETMMAAMAGKAQLNGESIRNQPSITALQGAGTQPLQGQSALGADNAYMSKFSSLLQSLGAFRDRQ